MQKLVARTMIVMMLTTGLSGLFMARPARAASRTSTFLVVGAIAAGLYYYFYHKKEKESYAMQPSDSKYLKSDRTAQASGPAVAPESLAASKTVAASELSPVGGSVALSRPPQIGGTVALGQPVGATQ
jgi:hypothetical protein